MVDERFMKIEFIHIFKGFAKFNGTFLHAYLEGLNLQCYPWDKWGR